MYAYTHESSHPHTGKHTLGTVVISQEHGCFRNSCMGGGHFCWILLSSDLDYLLLTIFHLGLAIVDGVFISIGLPSRWIVLPLSHTFISKPFVRLCWHGQWKCVWVHWILSVWSSLSHFVFPLEWEWETMTFPSQYLCDGHRLSCQETKDWTWHSNILWTHKLEGGVIFSFMKPL